MFDKVYFIEYDQQCVDKYSEDIDAASYEVFVGDQADIKFLEQFKYRVSTEGLDIIVDDGGHMNYQVLFLFFIRRL